MEEKEKILDLIEKKQFAQARKLLEDFHPADIAQLLDEDVAARVRAQIVDLR